MIRSFYYCLGLFLVITLSVAAQTPEIDSLQRVLKTLPQDTSRVNTLISLCQVKSYLSVDAIPQLANEALTLAEKIRFEAGEVRAYSQLGIYYHHKGNTAKAVDSFLKALNISEKINDSTSIADLYNKMGVIYLNQNEDNEALYYFDKAYKIWDRQNFEMGLSKALYNIGVIYERQQNDSLALINYQKALKFNEEGKGDVLICGILKGIGDVYFKKGEYSESLSYQERALQHANGAQIIAWIPVIYGSISKIYIARDMPRKALAAADSAMKYTLQIKSKSFMADCYFYLQKAYEKLNDYQKAYQYQSSHIALSDSLKNIENVNAVEKLRREYEVEKKDIEMNLMTYQYEASLFRRNTFIVTLVGLLALVVLAYSRYRIATKRKLAERRAQLEHYTLRLLEKSEVVNKISDELAKLKNSSSASSEDIEKFNQILNLNIHTEENWEKFKELFDEVYPDFFARLRYQCPTITPSELRLSAVTKLCLSLKDAAIMLGISPSSVKQGRYRLRKKFGLESSATLEDFIAGIN